MLYFEFKLLPKYWPINAKFDEINIKVQQLKSNGYEFSAIWNMVVQWLWYLTFFLNRRI